MIIINAIFFYLKDKNDHKYYNCI